MRESHMVVDLQSSTICVVQRLKKWISKQAEREEKKRREKEEKMEKLKRTPKHEFKDDEYFKTKEEILEKGSEAVEEGMIDKCRKFLLQLYFGASLGIRQALADAETVKNDEPTTSRTTQATAESSTKRKPAEPPTGPVQKKSKMLW